MTDRLRPLAKTIVGYCDPLAVDPGGHISVHVSSDVPGRALSCELVRLTGPGTPDVPPPYEVVVAAEPATGEPRQIRPGSHIVVDSTMSERELPTMLVLVRPTHRSDAAQAVLAWGDPFDGDGLALCLDADLRPALVVSGQQLATAPRPLPLDTWSAVAAGRDATGRVVVQALQLADNEAQWQTSPAAPASFSAQPGPLVIGAAVPSDGAVRAPFTGLLEAPTIVAAPLADMAIVDVLLRDSALPDQTWLSLDFTPGGDTWSVPDLGPHHHVGVLRNVPLRGVPGARWSGRAFDWRTAPQEYAAIHFLADAVEDCGWPADWSVRLPDDAPSGFYAARVAAEDEVDFVPFFVRPGAASAEILLVAPTATYLAYANSRFWWEDPIQELVQDRLVELGAEEQYLLAHPEVGLSNYDQHLDGTPVCFSTTRRPNLNMRPGHVRGEGYASDLHTVAWLEHLGLRYDIVTDADWHAGGRDLLEQYSVVLTGTHPEYETLRMVDDTLDWVHDRGRFMYLGGNGFAMNIVFDADRPWIMENRRVELWEGSERDREALAHNIVDGERGGRFEPSGRQPALLTGVQSATMGFDRSYPYHLAVGAKQPEAAFALAGISAQVIGTGVVGQEWDNSAGIGGLGADHLVLASSRDHSLIPPLFGAMRPDYHADLVLYLHQRGGTFSVSSMAWAAELAADEYDNDVARMTENVLRRFLDPTPFRSERATR